MLVWRKRFSKSWKGRIRHGLDVIFHVDDLRSDNQSCRAPTHSSWKLEEIVDTWSRDVMGAFHISHVNESECALLVGFRGERRICETSVWLVDVDPAAAAEFVCHPSSCNCFMGPLTWSLIVRQLHHLHLLRPGSTGESGQSAYPAVWQNGRPTRSQAIFRCKRAAAAALDQNRVCPKNGTGL